MKHKTCNMKPEKGFTLIELLVAMTIFLIVTTIVSNVFIKSLRTQKAITALIAANDNISSALEQMTREMRTGKEFCGGNCPLYADNIFFTNAHGEIVTYKLNSNAVERQAVDPITGLGDFYTITADNVTINRLNFYTTGSGNLTAGNADSLPTKITIILGANIRFPGASADISVANLQTTVTARTFDN